MRAKKILLGVAVVLLALTTVGYAQDTGIPDTVYIGQNGKAFATPGGFYRVPIYLSTDQNIMGLNIGIEFGINSSGQVFDSMSLLNSVFSMHNYFDLTDNGLFLGVGGIDLNNPDTVGFGGACRFNPLPPGSYRLCDLFFHGQSVGAQMLFDTAFYPPAGLISFVPFNPQGAYEEYIPVMVIQPLTLVPDTPGFTTTLPATINGTSGLPLEFSFGVSTFRPPAVITYDSMRNATTGAPPIAQPVCAAGNPVNFRWLSAWTEDGNWTVYFTATDAELYRQVLPTTLIMTKGVNTGDANCDGVVDVSDIVYMVEYMFVPGSPAPCIKR
jgi:hypothetical protein